MFDSIILEKIRRRLAIRLRYAAIESCLGTGGITVFVHKDRRQVSIFHPLFIGQLSLTSLRGR